MKQQGFSVTDQCIENIENHLRPLTNSYFRYLVVYFGVFIKSIKNEVETKYKIKLTKNKYGNNFERLMFMYLELAEKCFMMNIALGGIALCRSALEMGLRNKLLSSYRKTKGISKKQITLEEEFISGLMFGQLINYASGKAINKKKNLSGVVIKTEDIDKIFSKLSHKGKTGRTILNKFIHGDIAYLQDFLEQSQKIKLGKTQKQAREVAGHPTIIPNLLMKEILRAVYEFMIYLL